MVLLTRRALKGIIRSFDLGQRYGCHPYRWNKGTQEAEITKSVLQKGLWVFNVALTFGYNVFVLFQCLCLSSSGTTSQASKTFIWFVYVFFSFPVFFQLCIITAWNEFPEFVNQYLRYNRQFEQMYIPNNSRPKVLCRICEFIIVYVYSAFWLDFFAYITMVFFRPKAADQISSLVSTEMLDPRRLVLFALFVYYGMGYVVNACLLIFPAFGYLFSALQILQEFGAKRIWLKQCEPEVQIGIYQILFMQTQEYDRVYYISIAAAKIILMLLSVFCAYGGIRLHGLLAVTLGVLGASTTVFLGVFMSAYSEFDCSSEKALVGLVRRNSKQSGIRQKILGRQIRSLRRLQMPVCGMYVIDKQLVLFVIKVVCEGIIFLLVNY